MDNVTNLFRRKRINQQSMYGNFQYEKNSFNFYFIFFLGGCVSFFFVFLNNFFRIYALIAPCKSENVLI